MRNDEYMRRAIELARRGEGLVNPNPMVGCVVVKNGRIVAEGWHEHYGGYHAERNALLNCTEDVTGAELYVTLEPCCHTGKTPPCTDIIIERGIGKVYVGSDDPNPLVAGRGIEILKAAGIEVETHVLKDECDALNEIFFHYITTGMPFVAMKYAMTLDGKIVSALHPVSAAARQPRHFPPSTEECGEQEGGMQPVSAAARQPRHFPSSTEECGEQEGGMPPQIITGPEAHAHVHQLRKQFAGILVGIGTVLADDPMLNCRLSERSEKPENPDPAPMAITDNTGETSHDDTENYDPTRIIMDSHLRIPLTSQIVRTAKKIPTIVAYLPEKIDSEKEKSLTEAGIQLLPLQPDQNGRIDIEELFQELGEQGIDSILVEGGSAIHGSLLEKPHLINRVYAYIAPKIIGGAEALSPVGGAGISQMADALKLQNVELIPLGEDLCITGIIGPRGL